MQSESQAIDGGEVDLIVQGCGSFEELPDFLDTEDSGKSVFGLRANQRQGVPIALQNVLVEKPNGAVADTHGVGSESIVIFAVQEVGLKFLFGDQSRRFVIELSQ